MTASISRTRRLRNIRNPILLAVLMTLLNAFKPLHIDDTAFYYYSQQISRNLIYPYSFIIFWVDHPEPAIQQLAPPVFLYWWGLAICLFGQSPLLWKLWLFPIHLGLICSLRSILRRFCCGIETALLWMIALSPSILPGINLMLDVPALSLGLSALALFIRGCERDSWTYSVAGGLVAGLAAQTKYTGLSTIAILPIYGLFNGRGFQGLVAMALGAAIFVGCEALIAASAGQSHLLTVLGARTTSPMVNMWFSPVAKMFLGPVLFTLLGSTAAAVLALGLVGLGWSSRWALVAVSAVVVPGFLAVAYWPDLYRFGPVRWVTALAALGIGAFLLMVILLVGCRLWQLTCHVTCHGGLRSSGDRECRDSLFVIAWAVLELAMYLALTPFPAVRRIIFVTVTLTILAGRLVAVRFRLDRPHTAGLVGIAGLSVILGLFYAGVDFAESLAARQAPLEAARWVRRRDPNATLWYAGHWGFQFYAERAGMHPIVPGRSLLRAGDWLVIPDLPNSRIHRQRFVLDPDRVRVEGVLNVSDHIPFYTVPVYYAGAVPVGGWDTGIPRLSVRIIRVTEDFRVQEDATHPPTAIFPMGRRARSAAPPADRLR